MRSIKSFEKGLQILEVMSHYPDGVRIKDITNDLDESTSNLFLFLNSMINVGFIAKDTETGLYYITEKVHQIAKRTERNRYYHLKQAAQAEMLNLQHKLNENVMLAVLDGRGMHYIERLKSSRAVQILHDIDMHYPPHVTASGKAILAFLPEEEQKRYIAEALYHKFTEKSVITVEALQEDLQRTRERGYAINTGEFEAEIMAVASPIMLHGRVLASLSVQFPTFRYNANDLEAFGTQIMQSAQVIGAGLG